MPYRIIFYENEKGISEVWNFLEELRAKSMTNKNARIQYHQILLYIELLAQNGSLLPTNIAKHIQNDIWELRPGNNRIFYFYSGDNSYVLLHCFRKKTQKTPFKELQKALTKRNDYLSRKDGNPL